MGAMERPAWTIMMGVIWALIAVGAIICHLGVAKIVPAIEDFPARLENGFMNELGIGTLVEEIKKIEDEAKKIIEHCDLQVSECARFVANKAEDAAITMKCMDTSTT